MDRRAQAEGIAQIDHALQHRHPGAERNERQVAALQGLFYLQPVVAERDLQRRQQLFAVQASGGMRAAAVHEDAHAMAGQALGG